MLIINDLLKEKERRTILLSFELLTRLELVTSSLPRKCSTTELQQHFTLSSGAKVGNKFESTKKYGLFLQVLSEKYCFPNLHSAKLGVVRYAKYRKTGRPRKGQPAFYFTYTILATDRSPAWSNALLSQG